MYFFEVFGQYACVSLVSVRALEVTRKLMQNKQELS